MERLIPRLMRIKENIIHILICCVRIILVVLILPSVFVHELGHLMAALLIGIHVECFELSDGEVLYECIYKGISFKFRERLAGGSVLVKSDDKTYSSWQMITLMIAGILTNLVVAIICFNFLNWLTWAYGGINLYFAILSVWPNNGTDGYCCYQILSGKVPDGMSKSEKTGKD